MTMSKYVVMQEFYEKFHDMKYYGEGTEYESDDADRVNFLKKQGFLGEEIVETKDTGHKPGSRTKPPKTNADDTVGVKGGDGNEPGATE